MSLYDPKSVDPMIKHVVLSLRKTLHELYRAQPNIWIERAHPSELVNTLEWFDRAMDVARGFKIDIRKPLIIVNDGDDDDDDRERPGGIRLEIGVADQADVVFMVTINEDGYNAILAKIKQLISSFEVNENGVVSNLSKYVEKPEHLELTGFYSGTVMFGRNDDPEDDHFLFEVSTFKARDFETGKEIDFNLID